MPYAKYDGNDITYKNIEQLYKKTGISINEPTLPPKNLVKLSGTLSEFKGIFCYALVGDGAYMSKEQKEKQKNKLRSGAVLATLNGNSTAALAGLGHANGNDRSNEFQAQYITAKLDNTINLQGWLGFYKFNDGDYVEVVAEKHDDYYEVYAMLKPSEQIISLIPPGFAGRKYALKYYHLPMFILYVVICLLMIYFLGSFTLDDFLSCFGGVGVMYWVALLIVYKNSIATFITLTERIFTVLGWQDVTNINLATISKQYIVKLTAQGKYATEYNDSTDPYIRPPKNGVGWSFYYYEPEVLCKKRNKTLPINQENKVKDKDDK